MNPKTIKICALVAIPVSAAAGAILLVDLLVRHYGLESVWKFYDSKARASLFAGFLTLGGFLLSLKTFVVVQMKKELYDTDFYKDRFRTRATEPNSLYRPLKNLAALLFFSILCSLTTSATQFSVGLLQSRWTVGICFGFAAATLALLITSLVQIRGNGLDPVRWTG